MRIGYAGAIKLAIYNFHKHERHEVALEHLRQLFANLDLTNPQRTLDAEYTLQGYTDWFASERPIVAACKARVELEIGKDILLGGEVSRVDVLVADDAYRAILLTEDEIPNWQDQLRMPLLQRAIANKFERDEKDVSVGVQRLDGSELETRSYGTRAIREATEEARALAKVVSRLLSTEV